MQFLAARQSVLIALGLALALATWLISGRVDDGTNVNSPAAAQPATERDAAIVTADATPEPTSVQVRRLQAEPITREIVISARTEPARSVTVRAEADGRVSELGAERGASAAAGALLARLDDRARRARLAEAEALLERRRLEYRAAERLNQRQLQSATELAAAAAELETARARLRQAEIELENSVIAAPFAGVLERRPVELGDYLMTGDPVATLLELDPLLVVGSVSQNDIGALRVGMPARARLVTGETLTGIVRYVANQADAATRTFQVELQVDNPEARLAAGVSAKIVIPTATLRAFRLSPALLTLNEAGAVGVKTVRDNTVDFQPAEVVRAQADAVWVTLTETPPGADAGVLNVISVGQGFCPVRPEGAAVPEHRHAQDSPLGAVDGEPGGRS